MVCLDTDIIIDFLKEIPSAVKKISELQEEEIPLTTTAINTFELHKGAIKTKNNEAIESLNQLLSNLQIYSFNFNISKKAAEIFEYLKVKGELIDLADIMIAATVISNNEVLLTRNVKHFKKIPELVVEEL